MKIEAKNPETGETFQAEASNVTSNFVDALLSFEMSEEGMKRMIDNLDCSADAKSLLYSFSKATILVGETVIKIGRKILDFVCLLYKDFPTATFGMILGAIAGILISTIPIIGVALGSLFTSLAMLLGLTGGAVVDMKDKLLDIRIAEIVDTFSPLN